MTSERFERLTHIFERALECPGDSRPALLADLCGDDEALRLDVMNLLAADADAGGVLGSNVYDLASLAVADPSPIGQRIGPYRVVREIGHGGMGTVYQATRDDDQYRKQVAIKVINRGMDSDVILQRFRNERQILASLDHPNIARLLDGGTTSDGLPYFVMEYLEGRPITDFCTAATLAIGERVKLFRIVCAAVHYAHQNLVIHRDLKPGNVIVTATGEPKLLDFGIAKLLGPEDAAENPGTESALRILTPEYASPEQLKGEAMTTASDVYGLGVLLYELLTGRRPYLFAARHPAEVARVVCEEEPPKPSTVVSTRLRRALRGDLDNVVLMALRKDPQRRYASAEQLSEDLGRYLDRRPVLAQHDTLSYRTSKFVGRNKASVVAASLLLVSLVAGVVTTARQARRAEHRFNQVRTLANSFMFEFHDAIEVLPGSTPARALVVQRALTYLDSLAAESSSDPVLQRELAAAYQRLGDAQSGLHRSNLGNTTGAAESYAKALSIRRALFAADQAQLPARLDLSLSYSRAGDVLSKTNDATGALAQYRLSLQLIEEILPAYPRDVRVRSAAAKGHTAVGRALLKLGEDASAVAAFRRSVTVLEELIADHPADTELSRQMISSYMGVAYVLASTGDSAGALALYRTAATIAGAMARANPLDAAAARSLMDAQEWVALGLRQNGEIAGALEHHHTALALGQTLLSSDPTNAQAHNDIGDIRHEIGNTLTAMGETTRALESFRESLVNYEAVSVRDRTDTNARRQVYATHRQMANTLLLAGRTAAALEKHRLALEGFRGLAAQDPANTETQYDIALSYRAIGNTLVASREAGGALEQFGRALPIFARLLERSPINARTRADLAGAHADMGSAHVLLAAAARQTAARRGEWQQARASYGQAHELYLGLARGRRLGVEDQAAADRVVAQMARCDAAIRPASTR